MSRIHAHKSFTGHLLTCVVDGYAKEDYSCCQSVADEVVEVAEEIMECKEIQSYLNAGQIAAWTTIKAMKGKNACFIASTFDMLASSFGLDF